jgi:hypothetical protein
LLKLKALLTPFGIRRFYTAAGGRIAGTWSHTGMWSASTGRNSWNENISRYARALNV